MSEAQPWLTAVLGTISAIAIAYIGYLKFSRKSSSDEKMVASKVDSTTKVKMRQLEIDEERQLSPLIQTLFEVLKSRVKELESALAKRDEDFKAVWHGVVERGFLEAESLHHLIIRTDNENRWFVVSAHARKLFEPKSIELRSLKENLKSKIGREPTDDELEWALEVHFQGWLIKEICPNLGLSRHGCLAIACVIARENNENIISR